MGYNPDFIYAVVSYECFQQVLIQHIELQSAMEDFVGQLIYSLPSDKILQQLPLLNVTMPQKILQQPIPKAITVFTDGSRRTSKSAIAWYDQQWRIIVFKRQHLRQRSELKATYMALKQCPQTTY